MYLYMRLYDISNNYWSDFNESVRTLSYYKLQLGIYT